MRVRNFLFHRVSDDKDKLWMPMPLKLFEEIIRYLTKNFQVVMLEEFLQHPASFKSKKSLVTISFDDGYKDNLEYAAPLLQKYNCPASFYVVTDCIDRNIPTWTYIVDYAFQHTSKRKIEIGLAFVPEELKIIPLTEGINARVKGIKPWMKSLSNSKRTAVLEAILEQTKDTIAIPRNLMMNWNEVSQLCGNRFTVSSHTHTHPMLANLEGDEEVREELLISYNKIADHLNIIPRTISYPIGSYNKRVEELAIACGYTWGLAVEQRFFNEGTDRTTAIPRVELYAEPKWKVHARINGIYNGLKRLVK
ncbi:MAG: polysaccharide deacetylase family protein [Chitinophagaceae bacterium]|nr:MAG: polysaccharide deacetylase family protein [Chitinophagaceae bacterium]